MIIYAKLNSENYIIGYQYNEPSDLTSYVIINTTIKPTIHKHKFINNKLVECDYSSEYKVRLEAVKKSKLRATRKKVLKAFDIYKSNVEYGIITETASTHQEIIDWYNSLLDLNEDAINNVPSAILKYIEV